MLHQGIAQSPIYYARYQGAQAKLFALGIGTDTQIQVNLPEQAFPKISNSGRFMGVTSSDPVRPGKISQNIYLIDFANNNSTRMLVENNDLVDPQSGAAQTTLPLFKAFAPDGSFVAASNFVQVTGGNQGGLSTIPRLDLYRFTDGSPVASVVVGQIRTGDYTEMAGLDWSKQRNVLVTPLRRPAPPQVNGQVTAIYLLDPVQDAIVNNRFTQVSFPAAFISGVSRVWDNDMLPAFSPDGNQIAFFRARQSISPSGRSFSQCTLLVMNTDGSNLRSLAPFDSGRFPTGLSWSPDGTKVIVGTAPQLISMGSPLNQGDFARSQLVIVETNGLGASNVDGEGRAFPSWAPDNSTGGGSLPPLRISSASGGDQLIIWTLGAAPGMSFILESTTDFSSWGNPQSFNGIQLNGGVSVTKNLPEQYFRIRNN